MIRYGFTLISLAATTAIVLAACSSFESEPTGAPVDAARDDEASVTPVEEASVRVDSGVDTPDSEGPSIVFTDNFETVGCGRFEIGYGSVTAINDAGIDGSTACRLCASTSFQYINFWTKVGVPVGPGEYSSEAMVRVSKNNATKVAAGFVVGGMRVTGPNTISTAFTKAAGVYIVDGGGQTISPGVFVDHPFDAGTCVDVDDVVMRKLK